MFRLLILIASFSFSAAIPLHDSTELKSDKASNLKGRVSDSSGFFNPISINSVALDLIAPNSKPKSESSPKLDPGTEEVSSQNSDNQLSALSTLGPSIQIGDQNSSPPPPPLVLASNSGINEHPSNMVPAAIDTNSGTDAQDSDFGCASDSTKATKLEEEKICPNLDYYQFPPNAELNPDESPGEGIFGPPTLEEQDMDWFSNNERVLVSSPARLVCARHPLDPMASKNRPFPVCCAFPLWSYDDRIFGPGVTDQSNCLLLIPSRPYCTWYPRYCCEKLITSPNVLYGWKGINCILFS